MVHKHIENTSKTTESHGLKKEFSIHLFLWNWVYGDTQWIQFRRQSDHLFFLLAYSLFEIVENQASGNLGCNKTVAKLDAALQGCSGLLPVSAVCAPNA